MYELTTSAIAGTSLGFDLIIIILPLPVLWKLQLHLKQKVLACLHNSSLAAGLLSNLRSS